MSIALAAVPGLARAQKPEEKAKRIGLLVGGPPSSRGHLDRALTDALRAQGYVEGRNLVIERRYADGGGPEQLRVFARELEALKLDAVVTTCTPSTRLMKAETATTPIVMASVSDPVGQGLIASFARPGSNVTGTSSQVEDILPKMLELLAAVLPKQAQVAVLSDKRNAVHPRLWEQLAAIAPQSGLKPRHYGITTSKELEAVIDIAAQEGAQGLFVLPDHPVFLDLRHRIVAAAGKHRLPGLFWAREFVEAGGLISYGENLSSGWQRAAGYVSRVVRGTRPTELPVAQPTTFELVVSTRAAKALGISVPTAILARADRIID